VFGAGEADKPTQDAIVSKLLGRLNVIYGAPKVDHVSKLTPQQLRQVHEMLSNPDIIRDILDEIDQLPRSLGFAREGRALVGGQEEHEVASQAKADTPKRRLLDRFQRFEARLGRGGKVDDLMVRRLAKQALQEAFPHKDIATIDGWLPRLIKEALQRAEVAHIAHIRQLVIDSKVVPENMPQRERHIDDCVNFLVTGADATKRSKLRFAFAGGREHDFGKDIDLRNFSASGRFDTLAKVHSLRDRMVEALRVGLPGDNDQ
jgi:hypothetical protein